MNRSVEVYIGSERVILVNVSDPRTRVTVRLGKHRVTATTVRVNEMADRFPSLEEFSEGTAPSTTNCRDLLLIKTTNRPDRRSRKFKPWN